MPSQKKVEEPGMLDRAISAVRSMLSTSPDNSKVKGPLGSGAVQRASKGVGTRAAKTEDAGRAAREAIMKASGAKRNKK